jgi:hypothetical protein
LIETRTHPAFAALLDRLWRDLAEEVDAPMMREAAE